MGLQVANDGKHQMSSRGHGHDQSAENSAEKPMRSLNPKIEKFSEWLLPGSGNRNAQTSGNANSSSNNADTLANNDSNPAGISTRNIAKVFHELGTLPDRRAGR